MAAGDTIGGAIRVVRQTGIGHRRVVAGAFPSAQVDHLTDLENSIYINPPKGMPLPMGMMPKRAGKAVFHAGESMHLEHKSASLAELATVTLSEIQIDVIEEDLNTKDVIEKTLTVADQTLSGDVTSSTTAWVTFFTYVVPDRTKIVLAGSFNATLLEKA